jgi:ATP-dependent helicase/nuclease subunit A
VSAFLERFGRWRRLARQASLSRCLEAVLQETHYAAWLLTQPRGEQRHANVQRLLGLAQQFDQFQRHGLFRFLRFIEAQQIAEIEPEVPSVCEENSVRLMSIHQSKGLEFPVVVLADLGKAFNVSDLRADIILDEQYGLCPQVKPPHTGKRYPSLPFWLARQRQQREMLGEELRLLYVAMTRARDTLVLTGNISEAKFKRLWEAEPDITPAALEAARSFSDWLGCWFARNFAGTPADQGENELLRWTIHSDTRLIPPAAGLTPEPELTGSLSAAAPGLCASLRQRLEWSYPFAAATRKPAKASVTALRRLAAEQSEEEAARLFADEPTPHAGAQIHDSAPRRWTAGSKAKLTGTELGAAHHTFLQLVSLERTGSAAELEQEAQRLLKAGTLTADIVTALDFHRLAAFWRSPLGRKTREQRQFVHRELEFTARFSPIELATLTGIPVEPTLENEFIVVQGVADLAVILPDELWLLDFKSDLVSPSELAEKVKRYEPQLKLYAHALEQIYRRPVSAAWLYFLACDSAVRVALQ